jgi:hypothetical protein
MIYDHKTMDIDYVMVHVMKEISTSSIGNIASKVEFSAIKRADYIVSLEHDRVQKERMLHAILSILGYLRPLEKKIIELKYREIQGYNNLTWGQVADKVGYTVVFCQKKEGGVVKRIIAKYYEPVRSD